MENGVLKLAQYLINYYNDNDLPYLGPRTLQKLLFFLRYEECKNQQTKNSYFAKNHNFEAWVYGPANRQSAFYDFENEPIVLEKVDNERLEKQYGAALAK